MGREVGHLLRALLLGFAKIWVVVENLELCGLRIGLLRVEVISDSAIEGHPAGQYVVSKHLNNVLYLSPVIDVDVL